MKNKKMNQNMDKDEMINIASRVWELEASSLEDIKNTIEKETLIKAIDMILNCKNHKGRVITMGLGTSAAAAKKISHTLCCVEIPSFFLSPADGIHGGLGALQKEDVAIAISKGGNTQEILNVIPTIKRKGAQLIGVTENEDSTLAQNSSLLLKIKVKREADDFNMLATCSTLTVISVFDAIAVILMRYTHYTKEQFAIIHPGGAVGERLLKGRE